MFKKILFFLSLLFFSVSINSYAVSFRTDSYGNIRGMNSQMQGLESGETSNCGWYKSSGTITIKGANGSDLSSINPCCVGIPSAVTSGKIVTLCQTSNVTFKDDDTSETSDLANWTLGATTGVAWANSYPIFIYAFNYNDTDSRLAFGFSRKPNASSFTTANLGDKGHVASNNSQNSAFLAISSGYSDYNGAPAILIGATVAAKLTTADDISINSSSSFKYGIGRLTIDRVLGDIYVFPVGQGGAVSGSHLYSTAGNVPTWVTPANIKSVYTLNKNGDVTYLFSTVDAGYISTPGGASESVDLRMALPYNPSADFWTSSDTLIPVGNIEPSFSSTILAAGVSTSQTCSLYYYYQYNDTIISRASVKETTMSVNGSDIQFRLTYRAY